MKTLYRNLARLSGLVGLVTLAVGQEPVVPPPAEIPTRLEADADGSMTVLFVGQPGGRYRIYWAGALAATPAEMNWELAADDVLATAGWTEWVDVGGAARAHPAGQSERYYQVVLKAPPLELEPAPVLMTGVDSGGGGTNANAAATAEAARLARLQEAFDAGRLLAALRARDYGLVLSILRKYGIAESTLAAMAARLGRTPPRVALAEEFYRACYTQGMRTEDEQEVAEAQGFPITFWFSSDTHRPTWWGEHVGTLQLRPLEPNVIRLFKWFDRHAHEMSGLLLNGGLVNNEQLENELTEPQQLLDGLFQLIKARAPDTFVWVMVVQMWDGSDVRFARGLTFAPDGVLVGNLESYWSPFAKSLRRLWPLFRAETPFVAFDFYGYTPQVMAAEPLEYGKLVDQHFPDLEYRLAGLGYRGLVVDYLMVERIDRSRQ